MMKKSFLLAAALMLTVVCGINCYLMWKMEFFAMACFFLLPLYLAGPLAYVLTEHRDRRLLCWWLYALIPWFAIDLASDLSVALALISGITDRALPDDLIAFGEVGLSGEVRAVPRAEYRIKEAVRLGFSTILIPKRQKKKDLTVPAGVKLVGVSSIYEVLPFLVKKENGEAGQ